MKIKGVDYYWSPIILNEYVPDYNMRLKWLTNFSGSNGYALVSKLKKHFLLMEDIFFKQKKLVLTT